MTKRSLQKTPVFFASALAVLFTTVHAQESLRVLSYNVRNCRGLDDASVVDVARIARVITNQAPDVAAIQELDCKTSRSGGRDVLRELAAAT